ncbi:hypothetical protein CKM354_000910100 [Cercospora kikuchii]|uniref:BTB domain-containing protein n=1 Tax=Cercospora kikuchii TaxID=84275 RepID=A0A9P3CNP7_9PEZI|nr:uncharacterized protein CKM354_000910100 [Cercospora kikuchii]GIZ45956.1 hypothetical protein CKM354_000910100 [Cercospora kikuchii]
MAEVHQVAPRGDVKLICPNEGDEEGTFIIVSSVVLRMGSAVFEAMLGPHFKEGLTLAGGARLELPLPEDEAASMLTMCQVMHMKAVTAAPATSKELLGLAVLADKYDCKIALSYPVSNWMQQPSIRESNQDRVNLFTAAYLMGLHHDFTMLGKDIVMQSCSQAFSGSLIPDRRPQKAIATLNKQRTRIVRQISGTHNPDRVLWSIHR